MAGTVTQNLQDFGHVKKLTITWVADSGDGSVPSTAITKAVEGRLHKIVTNPGTPAPTDNYDIVMNDANSVDVLQGVGANLDTANTVEAPIVYNGTEDHPVVNDILTFALTNNSVNSATGTVTLYYSLT